jgi:hypothetical protein
MEILLLTVIYDHIYKRTRDPVRSPLDKLVRVSISLGKARCIIQMYLFEAKCYLPSLRICHSDSGETTGYGKAK